MDNAVITLNYEIKTKGEKDKLDTMDTIDDVVDEIMDIINDAELERKNETDGLDVKYIRKAIGELLKDVRDVFD